MSAGKTGLLLLVVLLAGMIIGRFQAVELPEAALDRLRTELRTELGAELRADLARANTVTQREPGTAARPSEQLEAREPLPSAEARAPLSRTDSWIDAGTTDERPFGFSAYLVLQLGRRILIERCDAPDYAAVEVNAEEDPYLTPTCRTQIDGRVTELSDTKISYIDRDRRAKHLQYARTGAGSEERLEFTLDGAPATLMPGQKNTLWELLGNLPSVQSLRAARWKAHARLREASLTP
jgi:hypothetical protein